MFGPRRPAGWASEGPRRRTEVDKLRPPVYVRFGVWESSCGREVGEWLTFRQRKGAEMLQTTAGPTGPMPGLGRLTSPPQLSPFLRVAGLSETWARNSPRIRLPGRAPSLSRLSFHP